VPFLKTFDTRGILSTPASDVHDRLKNGTAIKIARETTNNQQKKYSVKHLQRQQFSFTKTSIKVF